MLLAFAAGLASFLSPCVLPLIPVYLAFLAGTTVSGLKEPSARGRVLVHAFAFVIGFSAVFVALGAAASAVGMALFRYRLALERLGGLLLVFLGAWLAGLVPQASFLYREARFHFRRKPAGLAGSALVGAAFAAGWTPCVGPVLTGILALASREGSVLKGVLLLSVYSAGFALPLLVCALAAERSLKALERLKPWLGPIEKATGAVLLLLGAAMALGWLSRLSAWTLSRFSGWAL